MRHILRYLYDVSVIRAISILRKHIRLSCVFFPVKFWTLCRSDDSVADRPRLAT